MRRFVPVLALASACLCDPRFGRREGIIEAPARDTPSVVSFGAVPVGRLARRPLAVRNVGTAPLAVTAVTVPAPFGGPPGETVVAPGEVFDFEITYQPVRVGSEQEPDEALITLQSDAKNATEVTVPATGWGIKASAVVDPAWIDFGDVYVGEKGTRTFTLVNVGTDGFTVQDARIESGAAAEFSAGAGNADLDRLKGLRVAGDRVSIDLTLSPASMGAKSAQMVIETSIAAQPVIPVPLAGRGVQTVLKLCFQRGAQPEVCLDAKNKVGTLDFGGVVEGQNAQGVVAAVNDGNIDVSVSGFLLDLTYAQKDNTCGPGSAQKQDFAFAPNVVPTRVAAGGRVPFNVTYTPSHACAGDLADVAQASVWRNDPTRPPLNLTVTLLGTSKAGRLQVEEQSLNVTGLQKASSPYQVHNVGSGDLTVTAVELVEGEVSQRLPDGGMPVDCDAVNQATKCTDAKCAARPRCRYPDGGVASPSPECQWFSFAANAPSWVVAAATDGGTVKGVGTLTFGSPVVNPPSTVKCYACMRIASDDPIAGVQCAELVGNKGP